MLLCTVLGIIKNPLFATWDTLNYYQQKLQTIRPALETMTSTYKQTWRGVRVYVLITICKTSVKIVSKPFVDCSTLSKDWCGKYVKINNAWAREQRITTLEQTQTTATKTTEHFAGSSCQHNTTIQKREAGVNDKGHGQIRALYEPGPSGPDRGRRPQLHKYHIIRIIM